MRLCEDMENGLHAMAQPLTVLRGALGALAMRGGVTAESNRYLEMSNQQVERLCSLMFRLQDLLDAHRSEAACAKVNLWELTASLLENGEFNSGDSGVRIGRQNPTGRFTSTETRPEPNRQYGPRFRRQWLFHPTAMSFTLALRPATASRN